MSDVILGELVFSIFWFSKKICKTQTGNETVFAIANSHASAYYFVHQHYRVNGYRERFNFGKRS